MTNPVSTKKKVFNSTQAGARIIKIAAFCFAVISWLATAEGLHMYVFSYAWQAHLISFGVQSVLFVLNLKLPYYFKQLGTHENSSKKHGNRLLQISIAVFYVAAMLFSSFFSFVYISNSVVYGHDSGYVDDNTVLTNSYQYILDNTGKYIDENIKATQIIVGKQLTELQLEISKNENSNESETLRNLQNAVKEAELKYQNALVSQDDARSICDAKQDYVQSLYSVRFARPEDYLSAQQDYEKALKDVSEAEKNVNSTLANLQSKQQSLEDWSKTDSSITSVFLIELLSNSPDAETLDKNMEVLIDRVTQLGENGNIPSNFAAIVQKTQALRTTLQQYLTLREMYTEGDLAIYFNESITYNTTIPSPSSPSFDEQKLEWYVFWQLQYRELKKSIQKLPTYNASYNNYLTDNLIDTNILENYDKEQLMVEIDELLRNCSSDINVIERSVNLLHGEYPFAAVFSAIIAVFLDLSSFLAGLFLYGISRPKTEKKDVHSL